MEPPTLSLRTFAPELKLAIIMVIVGYAITRLLKVGRRDHSLPPGPPTIPLLGNLHLMPKRDVYLRFTEWAQCYGGIFTLKLSSQNLIIITDPRIEKILLENKSSATSDRPPNYFMDLVTDGKHTAFARYDRDWRLSRRIIHEWLNKDACNSYMMLQQAEVSQMMHDVLHDPERFYDHALRYTNSLITSILAGIRSPHWDSPLVTIVSRMMHVWNAVAEPGVLPPLDMIPILQYVPEKFAHWKTTARVLRTVQQDMYDAIIDYCEEHVRYGDARADVLGTTIRTLSEKGVDKALLRGIIASVFEGGSETSADFIRTFILIMVKHPHVQKKAQEELDQVVGNGRSPTMQDYRQLPYCNAIVQEINRFRPVAPLTAPHYTTQDEMVDGYHIPRGSTLIVNMYGMFHDPDVYEDPESFIPERFLQNEFGTKAGVSHEGRRSDMIFGAGRRICGGISLASNTIALIVMNFLWAFSFEEAIDPRTGCRIPLSLDSFVSGLTSSPAPFPCNITVRSAKYAEVIEREMAVARINVFSNLDEDGLPEALFERLQQQIGILY